MGALPMASMPAAAAPVGLPGMPLMGAPGGGMVGAPAAPAAPAAPMAMPAAAPANNGMGLAPAGMSGQMPPGMPSMQPGMVQVRVASLFGVAVFAVCLCVYVSVCARVSTRLSVKALLGATLAPSL
jgi:hypothetical protein